MEVTKAQVAKGISLFIQDEMIPCVEDRGMKFVLGFAEGYVLGNPQILDKYLETPVFAMLAKSGNNYDLNGLKKAASFAAEKYGKLEITIPGIPLVSPHEKVFQLSKEDIEKLVSKIEGS